MQQIDYSIPRSVKIASNVPMPVDSSLQNWENPILSGLEKGLSIANMVQDMNRNRNLEARQKELFEYEKEKMNVARQNQEQLQKSNQIMQAKLKEAFDPQTKKFDTAKLNQFQDFVLPEVYQEAFKTAEKHNADLDTAKYNTLKRQSETINFKTKGLEYRNTLFDQYAGSLKNAIDTNNPLEMQQIIEEMNQDGFQVDPQILQLAPEQQAQAFQNIVNGNTSLTQQRQKAIEEQKRQIEIQKEKLGIQKDSVGIQKTMSEIEDIKSKKFLNQRKMNLEERKFEKEILEFNQKQLNPKSNKIPRNLTDSGTKDIGITLSAANITRKIKENLDAISSLKRGPVSGRLLSKNPYDQELKAIQNYVTMLTPMLARGIFKEVGVLTDKDIERYQKLIPTIKDDPKVASTLVNNLMRQINETYSITKNNYKMLGFDVGEHEQYNNVFDLVNTLLPEQTETTNNMPAGLKSDPLGLFK